MTTSTAVVDQERRWVEPEIADYRAFFADHPEAQVSEETLAQLEREISRRAKLLERSPDPDVQADLRAEITLRIIEAATSYRKIDPATGKPVYDYLGQNQGYIVWHAAGRVFSQLRRDRKESEKTVRLADVALTAPDGDVFDDEPATGDVADVSEVYEPSTARLELSDLASSISRRLSPAQRRVFALLAEGYSRPEIARLLKIHRKTVHGHVAAIRQATLEAQRDLSAGDHQLALAHPADQLASARQRSVLTAA